MNSPETPYGHAMGYVVVCWNDDPGELAVDWDGTVHADIESARTATRECSEHGYTCWLATLIKTKVNPDV